MDGLGVVDPVRPALAGFGPRCVQQARRRAARCARRRSCGCRSGVSSPAPRSRWPACRTRRSSACMRSRSPWAACWSRDGTCCSGLHPAKPSAPPAPDWAVRLRSMWVAPATAVVVLAWLLRVHPGALPIAALFLVAWAASPALMWALGQPRARKRVALSVSQREFLRRLARRTWAFFEAQVDDSNHWLPPDNIQEHPSLIVARRTSPTNIGLALLANLSAHDFGYSAAGDTITRTSKTLRTLADLPRYPRPLPQLVRHRIAAAAVAALRVDGGQRQSVRTSADAAPGLARTDRPAGIANRRCIAACATRWMCSRKRRRQVLRRTPARDAG